MHIRSVHCKYKSMQWWWTMKRTRLLSRLLARSRYQGTDWKIRVACPQFWMIVGLLQISMDFVRVRIGLQLIRHVKRSYGNQRSKFRDNSSSYAQVIANGKWRRQPQFELIRRSVGSNPWESHTVESIDHASRSNPSSQSLASNPWKVPLLRLHRASPHFESVQSLP